MRKMIFVLFLLLLLMTSCDSESYPSKKAIENGDVVINNEGIYHFEKFESFLERQLSEIRITVYSDEGDAIITDLSRQQDNKIKLIYDNSRDKFDADRGVYKSECDTIEAESLSSGGVLYRIKGCSGKRAELPLFFKEG